MRARSRWRVAVTRRSLAAWSLAWLALAAGPAVAEEVWPGTTWQTVSPATVGMSPSRTAAAVEEGRENGGSGIIVRWGRRVGYWGDQRAKYDLKSTTKSFGSLITALAFKDKRIDGDTLVQPRLPELGIPQSTNQRKAWLASIKVKHLLTHTAGFGKSGGVTDLRFPPGSAWSYSDGGPNWLADLLTVLYRKDLRDVLQSRVLGPMGIAEGRLDWRRNLYRSDFLRNVVRREFGSGIATDVDVMARIGLLLKRQGRWKSTRILLAEDVDRATSHRTWLGGLPCVDAEMCQRPFPNDGYGLLFWTNANGEFPGVPRDAYYAYGLFDSFILVMPQLGIIIARAGPDWRGGVGPFLKMVADAVN